jgi:hypothetical protein
MNKSLESFNLTLVKAKVRFNEFIKNEQGDVPGWVLVTVMTAGLVVAIWSIADDQLKSVLQNAIRSVSAP